MAQKTLHDCAGAPQNTDPLFISESHEYGTGLNQELSVVAGLPEALLEQGVDILPLAEVERIAIEEALAHCSGNIQSAAMLLRVAPSTIYRKINGWK